MTIAELIAHLSSIRNQDAPIMIRTYLSGLGQSDLDPVGYVQRIDGAYVIELEDPWATNPSRRTATSWPGRRPPDYPPCG